MPAIEDIGPAADQNAANFSGEYVPGLGRISRGPLADLNESSFTGASSVYFPKDLLYIDHWVTFRAFKFDRVSGQRVSTGKKPQMFISLPVPLQLQTGYDAGYENTSGLKTELGAIGGAALIDSIAKATTPPPSSASLAPGESPPKNDSFVSRLIADLTQKSKDSGTVANLGAIGLSAAASTVGKEGFGAGAIAAAGIARNPFNMLLYHGPSLRSHKFSYRLAARNAEDTKSIHKIISAFKYFMSGKYGLGKISGLVKETVGDPTGEVASRAFFEYPEYFEIDFHYPKYLFSIGPSVLKNFSVNYHPENYPAYVKSIRNVGDSPAPLEVSIDLEFQERDVVTKDDILQLNR